MDEHKVIDLRGAKLGVEGLDDGSAIVTISRARDLSLRFSLPPQDVRELATVLHAIERKGWAKPQSSPEAREHASKPITVWATPDFNAGRGLFGMPGFDVVLPDGRTEWMAGYVFEQLFEPSGRYWREG